MIAMALSRIGRYPFGYMVATKTMLATVGLLITGFLLRPLYRRTLGEEAPLERVIIITVVASYIAATVWTMLDGILDVPIARALLNPNARLNGFWGLFGGNLYNAYTILAWSLLYVGIKRHQALIAERERTLRAEALAHRARLEALRWQLNPHFLFNALNAISTLVIDGRGTEAAAMIARLGDLLRSTLEVPSEAEIPLASEMELVRRYLDIEQVRLGDRLKLDVAIDDEVWKARVPSLLLQPIVENAVRHAVATRTKGGRVNVSARRAGDRLHLVVEDDGPGLPTTEQPDKQILRAADAGHQHDNGAGIGLTNTRQRLHYLYGDRQQFTLDRGDLGGLRVRFDLPFHE
jgi:two-component system LytT family sensor kinase